MRNQPSNKDRYLNDTFSFKSKTLDSITEELKRDDKWGINIGYHEVSILGFLIKSLQVKSILEIGTLYGFSTYGMALYLPEGGKITSLEKNIENHNRAKDLLSSCDQKNKIELIQADASEYLDQCKEKYDLIFIDANKSGYLDYLEKSIGLISEKGMVIGDNTFLFGHVYNEGDSNMNIKTVDVMKKFNTQYVGNEDFLVTILPTTEGMTLIKKK